MVESEQNGTTEFVICLHENSERVIGKVGVWRDEEIGFLLHRENWRKGIMREAVEALLGYLFAREEDGGRGFEFVVADADPRNEASVAFLLGLGFVVTGEAEKTIQVGREWVDSLYLGLRTEVWEERHRGREGDSHIIHIS